jgi:hypothetical protein
MTGFDSGVVKDSLQPSSVSIGAGEDIETEEGAQDSLLLFEPSAALPLYRDGRI